MVKSVTGALLGTLAIKREANIPLYRQIEDNLRQMILSGALLPKQKLPSTRELATELTVSRITVKSVYEQLIAEGYVEAKVGAGTFVSEGLDSERPFIHKHNTIEEIFCSEPLSMAAKRISLSRANTRQGSIMPFRPGVPALDKFPLKKWKRCVTQAMKEQNYSHFSYGEPTGAIDLRKSIASHLADSRGMQVIPEQILITSGAQQAFVLISYVLINAKDTVWYENPGHIAGREVMNIVGAKVEPVPIDREGLDLEYAKKHYDAPKLIFTTPSHQQPLGVTMSLARRLALIKHAAEIDAWIIEDDYDSEFRYRGRPLPALSALDNTGRVLYVGTFSKSMFSAIRIGYLVIPELLVEPFAKARNILGQSSSPVTEIALAQFLSNGSFSEHIRKMRRIYRERKDGLLNALEEYCGDTLSPRQTDAGMHVIADLKIGIEDWTAHNCLLKAGIDSLPLSIYYQKQLNRNALVLGFANCSQKVITNLTFEMGEVLRRFC